MHNYLKITIETESAPNIARRSQMAQLLLDAAAAILKDKIGPDSDHPLNSVHGTKIGYLEWRTLPPIENSNPN